MVLVSSFLANAANRGILQLTWPYFSGTLSVMQVSTAETNGRGDGHHNRHCATFVAIFDIFYLLFVIFHTACIIRTSCYSGKTALLRPLRKSVNTVSRHCRKTVLTALFSKDGECVLTGLYAMERLSVVKMFYHKTTFSFTNEKTEQGSHK